MEVHPPSTTNVWPVICLDSSDKKNRQVEAMSLTSAALPNGVMAAQSD